MSYAVLEITDGTTSGTVSLLNGPVYLENWDPAGASLKNGGIFVDSPVQDYRYIVSKSKANTAERIDVSVMERKEVFKATMDKLILLLEDASTYWATNKKSGRRVWLKAQAVHETQARYADIIVGQIPSLKNPFAQPHLQQTDCGDGSVILQHQIQILLERTDFYGSPPGSPLSMGISKVGLDQNLIQDGEMSIGVLGKYYWTEQTDCELYFEKEDGIATNRNVVMRIVNGSVGTSWVGAYQQVDDLVDGDNYVFTARVRAISGDSRMIFYNGSGTLISGTGLPVTIDSGVWEEITQTVPAGSDEALRVAFEAQTAATGEVEVDWVRMKPEWETDYDVRQVGPKRNSLYSEDVITSYKSLGNITHIIYYDSSLTSYSDNLLLSEPPFAIVPAGTTPAANDIIWFGAVFDRDGSNPNGHFESLGSQIPSVVFDIEEPATVVLTEKLTNTGFETDTSGWAVKSGPGSLTRTTNDSRTGSASGSFDTPGWTTTEFYSSLVTFSESEGIFGAWFKPNYGQYDDQFRIGIEWYTSGDAFISADYSQYYKVRDIWDIYALPSTWNWEFYSIKASAPPTTAKARAFIEVYAGPTVFIPGSWGMYVDDASLKATSTVFEGDWIQDASGSIEGQDFKDSTDQFQNAGLGIVSFPQTALVDTALDGINAYWVGFQFSSVSAGFVSPTLASAPFVPHKNFLEIDASELEGDGPTDVTLQIREFSAPELGNIFLEDVRFDAVQTATTPDSTSAVYPMSDSNTCVAVCFRNINIPEDAHIKRAFLYVTPAGTTYTATRTLDLDIHVQHPPSKGNPIVLWATNGAMGSGGTDVSATKVDYANGAVSDWDNFDGLANAKLGKAYKFDVTSLVQLTVEDSTWSLGGDMAFHIENQIQTDASKTLDWLSINASDQSSWALEVEYVSSAINLRRVYVGSRTTNRGELFESHLSFTRIPQQYISYTGMVFPSGKTPNRSSMYSDPTTTHSGSGLEIFGSMIIHAPMAHSYSGRFRMFLRGVFDHEQVLQLRYRAGRQSQLQSTDTVTAIDTAAFPGVHENLLDFGEIFIDEDREPDIIEIQILSESYSGSQYLTDLWFLPSDEWFGEFNIDGESPAYGLMDHLSLYIDGVTYPFTKPRSYLREVDTGYDIANVRSSATQLRLHPGKTQRMYFLMLHLLTTDESWNYRQGLLMWPHAAFGIAMEKRTRYGSFR